MKKKLMVYGFFLFAVLALSIPGGAIADDTEAEDTVYDYYNLTIQPGSDETELSFTWFTKTETEVPQVVVYNEDAHGDKIHRCADFRKDGKKGKNRPACVNYFEGVSEIVVVESGGDNGGGPGGPAPGTMSTDTEDSDTEETAEEDSTIYACTVTVTGLKNNANYAYVIGDGNTFSELDYFSTGNANNYNFIFVGDPQIGASRDEDSDTEGWMETVTAALTQFENTSFILSAGDQVESATSDTQYDGFLSATELTSVPFAPAIGNHDKSALYAYHFEVPNESSEYGLTEDVGGDYWFTYGDTLFMVLNTNNVSAASHEEFIAETVEANAMAKWRVVVFHHSIYSSARHVEDVNDIRTAMYPVIDQYDIDIVLAGHDHFYARTYQLAGGEALNEEGEIEYTTDEACYTSTGRDGSEQTTCVDLIGKVAEEDLKYIGEGTVLNPKGTVYFTANSASGSKYYDYTYIEGYTNLYFAAYEQLETPTYLNVEVRGNILTVSAYRTDTGEMVDTYSILKTRGKHNDWKKERKNIH